MTPSENEPPHLLTKFSSNNTKGIKRNYPENDDPMCQDDTPLECIHQSKRTKDSDLSNLTIHDIQQESTPPFISTIAKPQSNHTKS